MKVKRVLLKYGKKVPFPWTVAKISRAGFKLFDFLMELGEELSQCSDGNSGTAKKVTKMIEVIK